MLRISFAKQIWILPDLIMDINNLNVIFFLRIDCFLNICSFFWNLCFNFSFSFFRLFYSEMDYVDDYFGFNILKLK